RVLAAYGLRAVRQHAVPVEQLERLDELMRGGARQAGGVVLADQAREALGWSETEAGAMLRGLGYAPARKPKDGEPIAWRRRNEREPDAAPIRPHSPFAALAALKDAPPPPRRRRRKAASK
ncbi:MAG TPA: phosphonate-binding protein, partial [Phenylobacterium sp.]